MRLQPSVKLKIDMLNTIIWKGYRPGSELFYLAFPKAKHDENAWAARSPIPFQFLFRKLPAFVVTSQLYRLRP